MPCNIPTQIVKPLAVIEHLVSSPLTDNDTSYYTALSKQSHSYTEMLFISVKVISYMVQAKDKNAYKPSPIEHTSPIRNTPDRLSSVIQFQFIRDITQLLDPYKRNPSDSPITTLTHLIHCYDRRHELLQSLNLDSKRITQSSQAIQPALELMSILFNSTNLP